MSSGEAKEWILDNEEESEDEDEKCRRGSDLTWGQSPRKWRQTTGLSDHGQIAMRRNEKQREHPPVLLTRRSGDEHDKGREPFSEAIALGPRAKEQVEAIKLTLRRVTASGSEARG